ncbi:MAG: hypothetical protein ACW99F_11090, partial [Candidatus Hodarchaeales archaeon]
EQEKTRLHQKEKFEQTAGFLDDLEQRVVNSIQRNLQSFRVQATTPISAPTPPRPGLPGAPPPPPPGGTLPSTAMVSLGSISDLRTDFEEMSMEEITELPPEFLEVLTPPDRGRIQARVKELKMLEKMTPEAREEYLEKKAEEKARSEATEGLGSSLTAMLDDQDSLFARMRRSADDGAVSGTGTFGKFTTEYNYTYCIACGKTNRTEDTELSECQYCQADVEHLVIDEGKSEYTYHECLIHKEEEYVDLNYSRGKQIAILSRWKTKVGEEIDSHGCPLESIRDISSAVLSKADPDKQFSYYITLFRLYSQLKLKSQLNELFKRVMTTIQRIPDSSSKDAAVETSYHLFDQLLEILVWVSKENIAESFDNYGEIQSLMDNLKLDIELLKDAESPQELKKASDVGSVSSKADQILNKGTTIILLLEKELIIPSRWKCGSCNNIFEVKDRNLIPEKCESCGKILTQLLPAD